MKLEIFFKQKSSLQFHLIVYAKALLMPLLHILVTKQIRSAQVSRMVLVAVIKLQVILLQNALLISPRCPRIMKIIKPSPIKSGPLACFSVNGVHRYPDYTNHKNCEFVFNGRCVSAGIQTSHQ